MPLKHVDFPLLADGGYKMVVFSNFLFPLPFLAFLGPQTAALVAITYCTIVLFLVRRVGANVNAGILRYRNWPFSPMAEIHVSSIASISSQRVLPIYSERAAGSCLCYRISGQVEFRPVRSMLRPGFMSFSMQSGSEPGRLWCSLVEAIEHERVAGRGSIT